MSSVPEISVAEKESTDLETPPIARAAVVEAYDRAVAAFVAVVCVIVMDPVPSCIPSEKYKFHARAVLTSATQAPLSGDRGGAIGVVPVFADMMNGGFVFTQEEVSSVWNVNSWPADRK
jgi:hypothetical protein